MNHTGNLVCCNMYSIEEEKKKILIVLMESCPQSVYKAKSDLMFSDLIQTLFFPVTISG